MKNSLLFLSMVVMVTLVCQVGLFAQGTVRWTGGTSTEWSTATNWTIISGTPSRQPSSNDDVQIGQAHRLNRSVGSEDREGLFAAPIRHGDQSFSVVEPAWQAVARLG